MRINRRYLLRDASLLGALAALRRSPRAQIAAPPLPGSFQTPFQDSRITGIPGTAAVPPQLPTLREAAETHSLLVGAAVTAEPLRNDPLYAELLRQQANIVVAEDAMNFGPIHPAPDRFAFQDADELFAFAASYGMRVRGHCLVWHRQLPPWFAGYVNKDNAAAVLTNHIETVAGRYAGRIHSWDVVNEAIQTADGQPDGLRNSPWLQLLGPGYIDLAFRTARHVDPKALLCYSEYGIESEAPQDAAKRAAVLELLHGMQARGVPVDAVSIQSHLVLGSAQVYGPGLQQFLAALRRMGLRVLLTEMDVNDRALPADIGQRDRAVAQAYTTYLEPLLSNPDVVALLTSGITDRYTSRNNGDAGPEKPPERGLPFDAGLRPKLAYVAEVQAVQRRPTQR